MASSAFAGTEATAPLPSGKPAGVQHAAMLGPNLLLLLFGAGIAIGGLALVSSNSGGNSSVATSTSATGTALP